MITPLKEKHIKKNYENLCKDQIILSAARNMPENMKTELLNNKEQFLRGVLSGLIKSMSILEKISHLLAQGKTVDALQLKAGLGAVMLLICQKLIGEKELPELKRIEVPEKKIIVP